MVLGSLLSKVSNTNLTDELLTRLKRSQKLCLTGGSRTSRAIITSSLSQKCSKELLIIVPTPESQDPGPIIKDGLTMTPFNPSAKPLQTSISAKYLDIA